MDKRKRFGSLVPSSWSASIGLIALFSLPGWAAEVPAGVILHPIQELVRNNGSEPATLDPHKTTGVPEGNVMADLLEGLLSFSPNGKIIPGVATSWENSADFKSWTFKLRPDAKWSNGDPVTAHDFVYSWRRLASPETASPYADYVQNLRLVNVDEIERGEKSGETLGMEALDDHTLQLSLSSPVPYLDKMMANFPLYPLHRATVEKFGDRWTLPGNCVSNGAYMMDSWLVNEKITLRRNPNYWNNAKTVIDKVTFLPIQQEESDLKRYQAGEVDMTYRYVPPDQLKKLRAKTTDEIHISKNVALYYYELNNSKPPFNDQRVRRALSLALQRDQITMMLDQGLEPAYSVTPSYVDGAQPKPVSWASWGYDERLKEAKKLLNEAGYSEKNPLKFTLTYDTKGHHKTIAAAAAAMWKKSLGVLVKQENLEWKIFMENRRLGKTQVARATWQSDYNEPSSFLNILRSTSSSGYAQYRSKIFDEIMDRALVAATAEERAVIYQQAEDQLMEDMPIIPMHYSTTVRLIKPYVGGYQDDNPMDRYYTKDLYIIKH